MKLSIMPTLLKINLIPSPQLKEKNGARKGGRGEYVVYIENLAWEANNKEI